MKKIIISLGLFVFLFGMSAEDITYDKNEVAAFYGPNWAYMVKAPSGWVIDQEFLKNSGILCAFHPKGVSLTSSAPLMYIKSVDLDNVSQKQYDDYIASDIASYKGKKGIKIDEREKLVQNDNSQVRNVKFYDATNSVYEYVIYLKHKNAIHVVVLFSAKEALTESLIPPFLGMAQSVTEVDKKIFNK